MKDGFFFLMYKMIKGVQVIVFKFLNIYDVVVVSVGCFNFIGVDLMVIVIIFLLIQVFLDKLGGMM